MIWQCDFGDFQENPFNNVESSESPWSIRFPHQVTSRPGQIVSSMRRSPKTNNSPSPNYYRNTQNSAKKDSKTRGFDPNVLRWREKRGCWVMGLPTQRPLHFSTHIFTHFPKKTQPHFPKSVKIEIQGEPSGDGNTIAKSLRGPHKRYIWKRLTHIAACGMQFCCSKNCLRSSAPALRAPGPVSPPFRREFPQFRNCLSRITYSGKCQVLQEKNPNRRLFTRLRRFQLFRPARTFYEQPRTQNDNSKRFKIFFRKWAFRSFSLTYKITLTCDHQPSGTTRYILFSY